MCRASLGQTPSDIAACREGCWPDLAVVAVIICFESLDVILGQEIPNGDRDGARHRRPRDAKTTDSDAIHRVIVTRSTEA